MKHSSRQYFVCLQSLLVMCSALWILLLDPLVLTPLGIIQMNDWAPLFSHEVKVVWNVALIEVYQITVWLSVSFVYVKLCTVSKCSIWVTVDEQTSPHLFSRSCLQELCYWRRTGSQSCDFVSHWFKPHDPPSTFVLAVYTYVCQLDCVSMYTVLIDFVAPESRTS